MDLGHSENDALNIERNSEDIKDLLEESDFSNVSDETCKKLSENINFSFINEKSCPTLESLTLYNQLVDKYLSDSLLNDDNKKQLKICKERIVNLIKVCESIKKELKNEINGSGFRNSVKEYAKDYSEEIAKKVAKDVAKDVAKNEMTNRTLTIMGVFSAIITIIITIVVTSTSWLSHPSNVQVVTAFVIPSAIAVMSISILLFVIFLHNNIVDFNGNPTNKQRPHIAGMVIFFAFLIVLGTTLFLLVSSVLKSEEHQVDEIYVIEQSNYSVVENINSNGEIKQYFRIEHENAFFEFIYDDSLLHNGNLFFCKTHNRLE